MWNPDYFLGHIYKSIFSIIPSSSYQNVTNEKQLSDNNLYESRGLHLLPTPFVTSLNATKKTRTKFFWSPLYCASICYEGPQTFITFLKGLTYFLPMFLFYTIWKHQKIKSFPPENQRFSGILRESQMKALVRKGLKMFAINWHFNGNVVIAH